MISKQIVFSPIGAAVIQKCHVTVAQITIFNLRVSLYCRSIIPIIISGSSGLRGLVGNYNARHNSLGLGQLLNRGNEVG